MSMTRVAISIEKSLLSQIDEMVSKHGFPNRSKAIQETVKEKLSRLNKSRLAVECSKLDRGFERAIADEGLSTEIEEWPNY